MALKAVVISNGAVDVRQTALRKAGTDTIQWDNQDTDGCTINFVYQGWPFEEPPQIVQVAGGKKSGTFTVSQNAGIGPYAYDVRRVGRDVPPNVPPGVISDPAPNQPPDPPQVDVG